MNEEVEKGHHLGIFYKVLDYKNELLENINIDEQNDDSLGAEFYEIEKLKNSIDINLINSDNLNYDSNINILPSYLSKGLEFDSVIVVNKDEFKKNSVLDMKLLYVSMTRALHKLVLTNGK